MTISLSAVLLIVAFHWVFDFILQTDWQAKNKSKSNIALLEHTILYSAAWLFAMNAMIIAFNLSDVFWLFAPITFIFHTVQDYITSRINSKLWAKGEVHLFFVSIGFDQLLHYFQLFLTYYLLSKA